MQTLLEIGLVNAVMATGLAFLAALIGRFCRRPAVMHLLWILVLLKLMTPPAMWVPFTWPGPLAGTQIDSRTIDPELPYAVNEEPSEDAAVSEGTGPGADAAEPPEDTAERDRSLRLIVVLEQWLDAVHVARAQLRA